jgi:hypothetical protein
VNSSGRSTAGSPKALIPQISNRRRRFWTSSAQRLGLLQLERLRSTESQAGESAFATEGKGETSAKFYL